jgi:hypothetical protein
MYHCSAISPVSKLLKVRLSPETLDLMVVLVGADWGYFW